VTGPGDAATLARLDQALALVTDRLDRHVAALAVAINSSGHEVAIANYFRALARSQSPDAAAALAAVAVGRLAQQKTPGGQTHGHGAFEGGRRDRPRRWRRTLRGLGAGQFRALSSRQGRRNPTTTDEYRTVTAALSFLVRGGR
jgi:hypothetical protein